MFQQSRRPRAGAASMVFALACAGGAAAAPSFQVGFTEEKVAVGLTSPSAITAAPDGRVFIAQQDGVIRLLKHDTLLARPFATLEAESYGERGLMGLALDTGFTNNGYVYVYYSSEAGGYHNRVTRLIASGDTALPGELLLLRASWLSSMYQWSHTGGGLEVGADGKLYIGVGDQEVSPNGQDSTTTSGKILRINTDGSIPGDNPWASAGEPMSAIWATGLRNPFKLGVDRALGTVYANDVGPGSYEEVNIVHKRGNYGWDQWEGADTANLRPEFTSPALFYGHGVDCAVMGGDVYRPEKQRLPERYVGAYFFLDFCSGRIRVLGPDSGASEVFGAAGAYSVDMTFDRGGNLYYIQRGYATGYTSPGASAAFKVTFADSSGGTAVRAAARGAAPAPGSVLAWADGGRLRVPAGMTALTWYDLSGRALWEARRLVPGSELTPPSTLRGVGRVLWRER